MAQKKTRKLPDKNKSTNWKGDVISSSQTDNSGSGEGVEPRAESALRGVNPPVAEDSPPSTLHVTLSCQDIVEAPEDEILVVGRYADTPLTGAVGAIDRVLDRMLTNWAAMGMFNSELGELFYVPLPTANPKVKAKAVIIAGMGETGRFSRDDLSYLMTNVGFAALQMQMPHLATVLIGTDGNVMTTERSLGAIIDGLRAALARYSRMPGKTKDWGGEKKPSDTSEPSSLKVEIFESRFEKYLQLYELLKDMAAQESSGTPGPGKTGGARPRRRAVRHRAERPPA